MTVAEVMEESPLKVVRSLPEVLIYGKADCKKCQDLKDKLTKHLKVPFIFIDWSTQDVTQFDWRNTRAVEFMADVVLKDLDITHPPLASIDGEAYDYAGTIKELKRRLDEEYAPAPAESCSACKW